MAQAPWLDAFQGEYEFDLNETFGSTGVFTRRYSIEPGKTFGIVQMYETGGVVPNRGGIFFVTTDADDCTARSDSYIVGEVQASGGAKYTFNNVRPEAYNSLDDGFATKQVYGTGSLTNRYRINSMYIDTSTNELVVEIEVFTTGNTLAKIHASFYTYKEAL